MRFLVALVLLVSLFQQQTALQAVVIDAAGLPVVGLRIEVETADGTLYQLHTDTNGMSAVTPLEGTQFVVTRVLQADGNELQIETTTLDTLQLALLPKQTRTILFRVSDGVFAVDPETLFAGADIPPTVATMQAALPQADPSVLAEPTSEDQAEQTAPTSPTEEQEEQEEQAEATLPGDDGRQLLSSVIVGLLVLTGALFGAIWYLARTKRGHQ
jgi:cobalamin biosynthesis Mg chelatase CobN